MKFPPELIDGLKQTLSSPRKVVIVTHRNPDADALGSSLGFKYFLEKLGHQIPIISRNLFRKSGWVSL